MILRQISAAPSAPMGPDSFLIFFSSIFAVGTSLWAPSTMATLVLPPTSIRRSRWARTQTQACLGKSPTVARSSAIPRSARCLRIIDSNCRMNSIRGGVITAWLSMRGISKTNFEMASARTGLFCGVGAEFIKRDQSSLAVPRTGAEHSLPSRCFLMVATWTGLRSTTAPKAILRGSVSLSASARESTNPTRITLRFSSLRRASPKRACTFEESASIRSQTRSECSLF